MCEARKRFILKSGLTDHIRTPPGRKSSEDLSSAHSESD
jgi:hypothetical protein